jgi:4-amino-4-deoxy-L-arabinose transferase-like glycosyltransferase/Ni/Co efflux regulator RcnB
VEHRIAVSLSTHRFLFFLLALFILLALTYAAVTPLFENPDESSHLQVIDYLARERRLYPPAGPAHPVSTGPEMAEAVRYHTPPWYYTPPLYHILGALLTADLPMDDLPARLIPNPAWDRGWSPQRNADPWNKNVFVHPPDENPAQSNTARAALRLRLLSIAMGAATVACTYAIARRLRPTPPALALAAAAFVALNPQFIALSASVSNDPLTTMLFALFLLCALRQMEAAAAWPRWAALGALAGAGMLTKQSTLILLPLGVLAILGQGPARRLPPLRKVFCDGCAFGLTACAVGGGWYLRNALRYHDIVGLATHFNSAISLREFGPSEAWAIFETYWAGFGWALLSTPLWVYCVCAILVAWGLLGWGRAFLPGGSLHHSTPVTRRGLALLALTWGMNAASLTRWAIATGAPYGRLLFPSAAAAAVLWAWGVFEWRGGRARRIGIAAAAMFGVLLAALTPWCILRPAFDTPYTSQGLPPTATAHPVAFQNGVTLSGYQTDRRNLHPGDTFPITLYWEATQPPRQRLSAWLQLGPQEATQRVADEDRWLGGTLYPSDFWRTGDAIRQVHRLKLPDTTPAPGLYWIRLGVLDEGGARVLQSDGSDTVQLGPWRVRAAAPAPARPVEYLLGDAIVLSGYDIARRGETLAITLTWKAKALSPVDYTVFVHLMDEAGNIIAQQDGPPAAGRYPTMWWLAGDAVPDPHVLELVGPLPRRAGLRVGMYDPTTGVRLPAFDLHGARLPDDVIPLDLDD